MQNHSNASSKGAANDVRNRIKDVSGGKNSSNSSLQRYSNSKFQNLSKKREGSCYSQYELAKDQADKSKSYREQLYSISNKNSQRKKSKAEVNNNNGSFSRISLKKDSTNKSHTRNPNDESPKKELRHHSLGSNKEKNMEIDSNTYFEAARKNSNSIKAQAENVSDINMTTTHPGIAAAPGLNNNNINNNDKNKQSFTVATNTNEVSNPRNIQSNKNLSMQNNNFNCNNSYSKFVPILQKYEKAIPLEYIPDIWKNLKSSENCHACMPKFEALSHQSDINFDMRAILIDWIIDVHKNYRLFPETLFMCISIIDRFLTKKQILRTRLQLLGTTALFISSKYEEIIYPCIDEFTKITDNAYKKEEVLQMENEIFKELEFDLTYPSSFRFFEIISLNYNFSEVEFFYGCYLLEYFLISPTSNKYFPSIIALAVVLLILKLKKYENYKDIYSLSDSLESQKLIKDCAKEIYEFPFKCRNFNLHSVYNKYSTSQFHCVAIKELDNHYITEK